MFSEHAASAFRFIYIFVFVYIHMMAKLESQGPMYYTNLQVTVNLISRNSLCCVLKADNFSRKVK